MNMRIMVVDDHEDICRMTTASLQKMGNEVESHTSPRAALAALKSGTWDLVISDLRMPGMDGIQLLNEIKALNSTTAVIMMTAHGTVDSAVEAMRLGAADFILK